MGSTSPPHHPIIPPLYHLTNTPIHHFTTPAPHSTNKEDKPSPIPVSPLHKFPRSWGPSDICIIYRGFQELGAPIYILHL